MSLAELDSLKLHPIVLPAYSLHTQSRERAMKILTDAVDQSVVGQKEMGLSERKCEIGNSCPH